jgi:fructokinase
VIRIGVDLGGTKIEALAIDAEGRTLARRRIASPSHAYVELVTAICGLVASLETEAGARACVGVGMPGSISPATGLVRNANSTQLNGRPFPRDLAQALEREVRVENDANCFALSEAIDGAGAGRHAVFGVILGTGVGGGLVLDGRVHVGPLAIAGEWGHNELPARTEAALPETRCWCGRRRCIETYLSGPGLAADHARSLLASGRGEGAAHSSAAVEAATPLAVDAAGIAALAAAGDVRAEASLARYAHRLASALAIVINVVDPDIVVLGGGLSQIDALYPAVAASLPVHVFSDVCTTPVVRNRHGDASGVRGAAWLWTADEARKTL